MEAATGDNCRSPCLTKGWTLYFFIEQFPLLLTAAWGQAGWVGGVSSGGWLLGEKVGEGGKGFILDPTPDPGT